MAVVLMSEGDNIGIPVTDIRYGDEYKDCFEFLLDGELIAIIPREKIKAISFRETDTEEDFFGSEEEGKKESRH